MEEAKKLVVLEDRQNARARETLAWNEAVDEVACRMIDNVSTDVLLQDILIGMIQQNVVSELADAAYSLEKQSFFVLEQLL